MRQLVGHIQLGHQEVQEHYKDQDHENDYGNPVRALACNLAEIRSEIKTSGQGSPPKRIRGA